MTEAIFSFRFNMASSSGSRLNVYVRVNGKKRLQISLLLIRLGWCLKTRSYSASRIRPHFCSWVWLQFHSPTWLYSYSQTPRLVKTQKESYLLWRLHNGLWLWLRL